MRAAAALLIAVTAAGTAACSIPEKTQYSPFGCNLQPLPAMAPNPVTIRGTILDPVMNKAGVPDALVEVFVDGGSFLSKKSEPDGSFVLVLTTTPTPHTVYLKVSKDSGNPGNPFLDTYFYPSTEKLTDDLDGVDIQLLTRGEANQLMGLLVPAPGATPILLAITVVDCNQVPQGGATVSTEPKADAIGYLIDGPGGQAVPDPSAKVTDRQEGTAVAVLVPAPAQAVPSSLTVSATMPSPKDTSMILTLRSHAIPDPKPGALIQTVIQP